MTSKMMQRERYFIQMPSEKWVGVAGILKDSPWEARPFVDKADATAGRDKFYPEGAVVCLRWTRFNESDPGYKISEFDEAGKQVIFP